MSEEIRPLCSFPVMVNLHVPSQSRLGDLYQSYAIRQQLLIHEVKTAVETTSHGAGILTHVFIYHSNYLLDFQDVLNEFLKYYFTIILFCTIQLKHHIFMVNAKVDIYVAITIKLIHTL